MKCPEGLTWIPDREYCSRCQPGYVWNAQWNECVKQDRTTIEPGLYHSTAASLFGWDSPKKHLWLVGAGVLLLFFLK